jgi:quercetin dioxygenase-like cupin family protein
VTVHWLWATPDVFEVQPGAATPYQTHRYEHEVYVMNGQARLRGETEEYILGAGDTALVLPNELHQFINIGPDVLRFLSGIPLSRKSSDVTAQVACIRCGRTSVAGDEAAIEAGRLTG